MGKGMTFLLAVFKTKKICEETDAILSDKDVTKEIVEKASSVCDRLERVVSKLE